MACVPVWARASLLVPFLTTALGGCAMRPGFTRPPRGETAPTIRGESSGRSYADCREAIASEGAAHAVAVLTFSAGVFDCGAELLLPDRAILRGAGLGRTFLDTGDGSLTALKPGRLLRVSDLAFGGTTSQASFESEVELSRVAVHSSRGVLFGDATGLTASVVATHSILSAWKAPVAEGVTKPVPVAFRGNERVAVLESVFIDVEQEFERFPAPGSVVMVSAPVEAAWRAHEPAAEQRRSAGGRPNLECGGTPQTRVGCLSRDPGAPGDDGVSHAAQAWLDGHPLEDVERHLRTLAAGFAKRYVERLAPHVRQVEAFWFDEAEAAAIEAEAAAADPVAALHHVVRQRGRVLAAECGNDDVPMKSALEPVRVLDRLLPVPDLVAACTEKLTPRLQAVVTKCETGSDWERALAEADDADAASGANGTTRAGCVARLKSRLEAIASQGPLALYYAHTLEQALQLGVTLPPRPPELRFDVLVPRLPYILARSGRALPVSTPATVRDRLLRRLQIPGIGDGRRVVETSPPCKPESGAAGVRAVGRMQLSVEVPGAPPENAVVASEVEQVTTMADIPPTTPDGAIAVTLVKRCEEQLPAKYAEAVDRFLVAELQRQVVAAADDRKAEHDVALLVVAGADAPGFRWVPVSEKALRALQAELVRGLPPLAP